MHRSEDVEAVMTDLVYNIRSMLVALPGVWPSTSPAQQHPPRRPRSSAQRSTRSLTELAGYKYDPEVYARRVRDREGWSAARR